MADAVIEAQMDTSDYAVAEGKPLSSSRLVCHPHGITKSGQEPDL